MRKSILSAVTILFLISSAYAAGVTITTTHTEIVNETFDGSFSDYWYRAMNDFDYSGTFSTNYTESGQCFRFENHADDPMIEGGKRSELEGPAEPQFEERIYNFSIFLPGANSTEEWQMDNPDADEIIVQWHNNPDEDLNEAWTMPSLALTTNTVDGVQHYIIFNLWDDDANTTTEKMDSEGKISYFDLGPIGADKGNWSNWSFYVKWGWLPEHNPRLEVYHNGVLVLERNGYPNTTNDGPGVNQQFGCYKWEWRDDNEGCDSILNRRVIYFDNVTVTEVTHTTEVILPNCENPATDPDGDGLFEDLNGNGLKDFDDVVIFQNNIEWLRTNNAPVPWFDYNENGLIDFDDVVQRYQMQ